jgi:hypothetical protein
MGTSPDAVSLALSQRSEGRYDAIFKTSHRAEKLWLASVDLCQNLEGFKLVLEA